MRETILKHKLKHPKRDLDYDDFFDDSYEETSYEEDIYSEAYLDDEDTDSETSDEKWWMVGYFQAIEE